MLRDSGFCLSVRCGRASIDPGVDVRSGTRSLATVIAGCRAGFLCAMLAVGAIGASAAEARTSTPDRAKGSLAATAKRCAGLRATVVVRGARGRGTNRRDIIVVTRKAGARVDGRAGDDVICGGPGADRLAGGDGNDMVRAGAGDDLLDAGRGRDRLTGGAGVDSFVTRRSRATTDLAAGELLNGRRRSVVRRLRARTVERTAGQVAAISGDPEGAQRIVMSRGSGAPGVGGVLVVAPGPAAPSGVLGRVTATERLPAGRVALTTEPATLDEAYSRFDLSVSGTLAELEARSAGTSPKARSASLRFRPQFKCDAGRALKAPEVSTDFRAVRLDASFTANPANPAIDVSLIGQPAVTVSVAMSGQGSCSVVNAPRIFVPLGGTPLGIAFVPSFRVSTTGTVSAQYTGSGRLVYQFIRSKRSAGSDIRSFVAAPGLPEVSGDATLDASLALNTSISLAGRAGIGGELGPAFNARAFASSSPAGTSACATAALGIHAALTAKADVFVRGWSFTMWQGTFGQPGVPQLVGAREARNPARALGFRAF